VPITTQAVLARTRDLPEPARTALAALAAVGGSAAAAWLTALGLDVEQASSAAVEAGLLRRRATADEQLYEIEAPSLCAELARALATPQLIAQLAGVLLALSDAPPHALLALASLADLPTQHALRSAAAGAARRAEARDLEIDALLGLGADPAAHSFTLLARLERLLRDAGRHDEHATVVAWLEAAADRDERIRALSLRRSAEQRARAGDKQAALQLAERALALAHDCHEPLLIAQALATRGAVQLFSADHAAAAVDLADARGRFSALETVDDREELARLDHNLGVVALYRGELEHAELCFRAALLAKRALGDRAGMRACLRNLGYTALRAERYAEAAEWLEQALALARSLRQKAGEAWSLVTLAEVEARRGEREKSDRHLAEIEALGPEVPAAVRADVALVRAELALAVADFRAFDAALGSLDAEACRSDAQVDASRLLLLSRAQLARAATEPAQLPAAVRTALAALRRARVAQLVSATQDAELTLRAAWQARAVRRAATRPVTAAVGGENRRLANEFIGALGTLPAAELPSAFARYLLAALGAERLFVLRFEGERLCHSWGIDMDGLGIAQPEQRVDVAALRGVLSRADYEPRPSPLGRGTRLLLVSEPRAEQPLQPTERLVAVAEQRFLPDAFAHVSAERARELNALLTLTARIALAAPAPTALPLAAADAGEPSRTENAPSSSTALPTSAPRHSFPNIVGTSRALRAALARLDAAIDSDLPLLLSGETGVGKELFARAVAESGARRGRPFVAVNCAAISSSLFEAEFFGHERGAFTGADRRRSGVFVQADTGVLLLDEIGELPLAQQAVLLRALETGRVRPLGAEREQAFDVRLIAASNRDLERAASEGSFRRDLLYRINVVEVRIPALRERAEDIEVLASHFLRAQGSALTISPQALALLRAYSWPGNVRELAHTMQRLSALHDHRIDVAQLPRQIRGARSRAIPARATPATIQDPKLEVLHTLSQTGGNISHAARVLGLTRHGLKKRMLRLGLRGPSRGDPS
jgi:two-component system response regulator HydG